MQPRPGPVDGDAYREVCAAMRRKYGIQHVGVWLASAVGRLRGRNPHRGP